MFSVSFRVRPWTSTTTFHASKILFPPSSDSLLFLKMCLDGIFSSLSLLLTTVTGNKRPAAFFGSESRPLLAANNQQPGYSAPMPVVRVTVESYDHVETGEAAQPAPPPRHPTLPMSNTGPSNSPMSFFLVLTSRYDPTVNTKKKDPVTLIALAPNKTTEELEGIPRIAHHSYEFYINHLAQSTDIFNENSIILDEPVDFEGPLPEFLQKAELTARLIVLTRCCVLHPLSTLNGTVKHLRLEHGASSPFAQTFAPTLGSSGNLESLELFEAIPSGIHRIEGSICLWNLQSLLIVTKAGRRDLEALQYFLRIFVARKDLVFKAVCSQPGPQLGFASQVGLALEDWRWNMASLRLS
ncbi:hypothetical protein HGRIS_004160 [Hohenbuehelia grisea]|uniref:Uncharacterized protein n=1 Tax=Hohenbuehelia grisea TaxID=104357 RepID=A0ABR3JJE5_9AGAR